MNLNAAVTTSMLHGPMIRTRDKPASWRGMHRIDPGCVVRQSLQRAPALRVPAPNRPVPRALYAAILPV